MGVLGMHTRPAPFLRLRPRPAVTPAPDPTAATASGLALSMGAHAALVAAVVGGGAAGSIIPSVDPVDDRVPEELHWVGLAEGGGGALPLARPGTRPPVAYVIPGRPAVRAGEGVGNAGRGRGLGEAGRGPAPRDARSRPDPRTLPARAPAPEPAPGLLASNIVLPHVDLPAAEVARLVAGVVTAAPDQAERVSRPEDFRPPSLRGADQLARLGVALPPMAVGPTIGPLPIPFVSNPTPLYPTRLLRAGVGGRVVVEFRVDTAGAVDLASLRVVESSGALFADAVREVLPQLRFVPGTQRGQAVAVTVRQPFLFRVRL